jgi:hypothetical protein
MVTEFVDAHPESPVPLALRVGCGLGRAVVRARAEPCLAPALSTRYLTHNDATLDIPRL